MKKSVLFLSFLCGLQIVFAFHPASAVVYRYNRPGAPAVEIDMGVLGEPQLENVPAPPSALVPPAVTAIPLDAPDGSAPQVNAPEPEKKLLQPFFTATPEPQEEAAPAPAPAPKPRARKHSPKKTATAPPRSIDAPSAEVAAPDDAAAPADITEKSPEKRDEGKTAIPSAPADMTLGFDAASSEISETARGELDALVGQMTAVPDMRVQIRAYAGGGDSDQSGARRMALSRGLMVRAYLTDKGIKPTRLDIRALGSETDKTPLDRVDIVFAR